MHKILVVEDEQLIVEFVEFLLRQEDFYPISATDGDLAVPLARQERPDVILLDILLPTVDGFEVLRQLKAAPDLKSIPVIIRLKDTPCIRVRVPRVPGRAWPTMTLKTTLPRFWKSVSTRIRVWCWNCPLNSVLISASCVDMPRPKTRWAAVS